MAGAFHIFVVLPFPLLTVAGRLWQSPLQGRFAEGNGFLCLTRTGLAPKSFQGSFAGEFEIGCSLEKLKDILELF